MSIKTETDFLRQKYIANLRRTIPSKNGNIRRVVRDPNKWARLSAQISKEDPIKINSSNLKKVWVWSDLHFFHKNIIEFSNRPYMNITEMNDTLIANHNDYVTNKDICIWVGDIGLAKTSKINEILDRCNGYKILIIGNHDFDGNQIKKLNFDETHLIYRLKISKTNLVFSHYPMYNIELPWFNIHGHLHVFPKLNTGHTLHFNANCEAHNYRPIELSKIIKIAKMRTIAANI